MRISDEIRASVEEQLRGVTRETALAEIEFLKGSKEFQDKRSFFGAEGQRSNHIWNELHRIAHD